MEVLKPPQPHKAFRGLTVFLAGSIEMGSAEDWQPKVTEALKGFDVQVLNPRRDDWDPTWEQSIDNPQFNEQVTWELDGIDKAGVMVFYFDPATKSPISLMELGLVAESFEKEILVCCPKGFWRKGNVDILCHRNHISLTESLEELISELQNTVELVLS